MRIVVGGVSRFKDILEVQLMVRRGSLYINAEWKRGIKNDSQVLACTARCRIPKESQIWRRIL